MKQPFSNGHPKLSIPHDAWAQSVRSNNIDLIPMGADQGAVVVAIGSGLMMATADGLSQKGVPVHCVTDVGRLSMRRVLSIIDWARWVPEHRVVVLHGWRSVGTLQEWAGVLEKEFPQLLETNTVFPCPLVMRLLGNGCEYLPPSARDLSFEDWLQRAMDICGRQASGLSPAMNESFGD